MIPDWPKAADGPRCSALIRCTPEDFVVHEELGFEPGGGGEHAFVHIEKRGLDTAEVVQRLSSLSGIHPKDIGFSGLKDRHAVTRQWFSVRLAGREEPEWEQLQSEGELRVLATARHPRKLKRGVHRSNRFSLTLRQVEGERSALEQALARVAESGVPNYFGEQRFGRDGNNIDAARRWMADSRRRLSRNRKSLYLSTLRALLFNALLAERVDAGDWQRPVDGDVCQLQGSRSLFHCERADEAMRQRAERGDVHPALPLWGRGEPMASGTALQRQQRVLADYDAECEFLLRQGLQLGHRAARVLADDFCWEFCDDDSLRLKFRLPTGSYATAVLAELVHYKTGDSGSDKGSE